MKNPLPASFDTLSQANEFREDSVIFADDKPIDSEIISGHPILSESLLYHVFAHGKSVPLEVTQKFLDLSSGDAIQECPKIEESLDVEGVDLNLEEQPNNFENLDKVSCAVENNVSVEIDVNLPHEQNIVENEMLDSEIFWMKNNYKGLYQKKNIKI